MRKRGPLPGMDPWLPDVWNNFHGRFLTYFSDRLNENLAPGLVATTQQRVIVESEVTAARSMYPDVHVVRRPASRTPLSEMSGGIAVAEPILVEMPPASFEQPYIEIVDANSGGVVLTVIEVVSPSNKRAGSGRDLYVQKQTEVEASESSLVEIDLVRGYRGVTLAWKHSASIALEPAYHVCTRRAYRRHLLEIYPIEFRQRLPGIRIPLREGEPDIAVDLQDLLDMTYMRGRFEELLNYDRPAEPPLDPDDAAWAAEQIAAWRAGG